MLLGFVLLVGWLAATAPLSRSLQPIAEPSLTLLASDGSVVARRGAVVEAPIRVETLPPHVYQAFLAIEDRRFYDHSGIDPWGIMRALITNLASGSVREGGSTITQQLAKLAFLSSERTLGRKAREMLIALWLEARLSKDEILSRYLSSVYFGDNVYGLRAAARSYFDTTPERLTVPQAAMLAGLVKAPSRLAPRSNIEGARERAELVMAAMVREGVLSEAEAKRLRPARLARRAEDVPTGTYFADWVFAALEREDEEERAAQRIVRTSLDPRLQALAARAVARADLDGAQAAVVAMRPDGGVVAMVGGRSYAKSPFNRAVQARRQPGSTFKLFVYLAALDAGIGPETPVLDTPVTVEGWSPANADGRYRGLVTFREAVAVSSNVAAVRLAERVGRGEVVEMARRLGIQSKLEEHPSLALGTSAVSLIELAGAYAGVAANRAPVVPHFRAEAAEGEGETLLDPAREYPMLLDLLWSSANAGTGRAAALPVPTFGKTGTTQDNRDAWFVGFVDGLVVGVWIGHDDNRPLDGVTGGGLPAQIWRDFVGAAIGEARHARRAVTAPVPVRVRQPVRAEPRPAPGWWRGDRNEREKDRKKDREKDRKKDRGKGKGKD